MGRSRVGSAAFLCSREHFCAGGRREAFFMQSPVLGIIGGFSVTAPDFASPCAFNNLSYLARQPAKASEKVEATDSVSENGDTPTSQSPFLQEVYGL